MYHPMFCKIRLPQFLVLLLFLGKSLSLESRTAIPIRPQGLVAMQAFETHSLPKFKPNKSSFFPKTRAIKALKKCISKPALEGEKASKFAKLAMTIFSVSLVLTVLGIFAPLFSVLGGIGFVASLVMAIYILIKEKNPKSRKLARTILIVSATLILLSLILALLLIGLFITLLV